MHSAEDGESGYNVRAATDDYGSEYERESADSSTPCSSRGTSSTNMVQEVSRETWTEAKLLQASLDGDTEAFLHLRDGVTRLDFAVYAASWLLENLGGGIVPRSDHANKSHPAEVGQP